MIEYDAPEEVIRAVNKSCTQEFTGISENGSKVSVFLDYIQKRKNTISSGVVIETKNDIYPCALPDVGCGFRLVKCNGISAKTLLKNKNIINRIDDFLHGKMDVNLIPNQVVLNKMLYEGHNCTASLFDNKREKAYENHGYYKISKGHIFNSKIYPDKNLLKKFNNYQGHFFEISYAEEEEECIYFFIHCGSFDLATRYMDYYYPLLAKEAFINRWSSKEEIIQGKFHIPKDSEIAIKYYNDIKCLMNFAVAYRDLVEYNITKILNEETKKKLCVELLSDYIHTKLSIGDTVIHQRGIQKLKNDDEKTYILSGEHGIASMLFKINQDGFFSHGVQTKYQIFENAVSDERLISKAIKKIDDDTVKRTRSVRKCFDYYLSKPEVSLDKYIYPFYSYKLE